MRRPDLSNYPGFPSKASNRQEFVSTANQAVFTLSNGSYVVGTKTLDVYVEGVLQPPSAFTEVSPTSFQLLDPVPAGLTVVAEWLEGKVPVVFGHKSSHEKGGQDEIDITKLKNYSEKVAGSSENAVYAVNYKTDTNSWNTAITNAIADASTKGRSVILPALTIVLTAPIILKSNVNIIGQRGRTIITATTSMTAAFMNGSEKLENVTFDGITFIGGTVDEGQTVPKRARVINPSFSHAVRVNGDLVVGETNPIVRNISVENCECKNIGSLPIFFRGVRGKSKINNTLFDNNLDVGWVFCERVICTNNEAYRSADNGFSISRGNQNVVCTNNTVDLACYAGIWLAGWENPYPQDTSVSYVGPKTFTCTGNVITNSGQFGIKLTDAPMYGSVVGNTINAVYRGNTDQPENNAGIGISIAGFPYISTPDTPTDYAVGLVVTANTIVSPNRGGIKVMGAKHVNVHGNLIIDAGTQYYVVDSAQPTPNTAIGTANKDQNFGVSLDNLRGNTVSNVYVYHNTVVDTRTTPFTNYALVATGTSNCEFRGNKAVNTRNSLASGMTQDSARTNTFENHITALGTSTNNAYIIADTEGYKRLGLIKRTGQNPQIGAGNTIGAIDFVFADKQNLDDPTAAFARTFSMYSGGYFFLKNGFIWFDSTGNLRKKSGTVPPTSDTDGVIVSAV